MSTTSTRTGSTPASAHTPSGFTIERNQAKNIAGMIIEMMIRRPEHGRRDRAFIMDCYQGTAPAIELFADYVTRRCEIELARAEGKPAFKSGDRVRITDCVGHYHYLKVDSVGEIVVANSLIPSVRAPHAFDESPFVNWVLPEWLELEPPEGLYITD